MLTERFAASELFRLWKFDLILGMGATLLRSARHKPRQVSVMRSLFGCETHITCFSDSLLHQFSSFGADAEDPIANQLPDIAARCTGVLEELKGAGGINHQLLAAKGLTLLLDGQLSFARFAQWAEKLSPTFSGPWEDQPHLWSSNLWQSVTVRAKNSPEASARLEAATHGICAANPYGDRSFDRIAAICDWYAALTELFPAGVPAALTRLGFNLLSAQFCWPLEVIGIPGEYLGLSLPIFSWLTPGGYNVRPSRACFYSGTGNLYQYAPDLQKHNFQKGALRWTTRWQRAIYLGLEVGKSVWRSQNGRMDPQERNRWMDSSIHLDFSVANEIVSLYWRDRATFLQQGGDADQYDESEYCVLDGRSAESYWVQVVLGLLLPQHRVPFGVVTGKIEDPGNTGEYLMGRVDGLEAKLQYASQTGFLGRMVLPDSDETRKAIQIAISDEATRDDLLQSSLCSGARDTADALQTSGWRRALFLGTPEARWAFGQLTHALFVLDQMGIVKEPEQDHEMRPVWIRTQRCIQAANQILVTDPRYQIKFVSQIQYVRGRRQAMKECDLGWWLAKTDHALRQGGNGQFSGPGLGIVTVRTRAGESDHRFWANIFDLLHASDELWATFQFGDLAASTTALAKLLNNFDADPAISAMPAPDLLVIFDDAGVTQEWGQKGQFPDDTRGRLRHLLKHELANLLEQRDPQRSASLGATRIVVIYQDFAPVFEYADDLDESPNYSLADPERHWVDALQVFQSGFTVHNARAVLNKLSEKLKQPLDSWLEVRTALDSAVGAKRLCYGRGEYYFSSFQRNNFPVRPNVVFDADLHAAAGLSFAPLLAGAFHGNSTRNLAISVHQVREASWHFHRNDTYAMTKVQQDHARKHLALHGFISSAQDWDTVVAMGRDKKRFGGHALVLAELLIKQENRMSLLPPHGGRIGLAINTATQALVGTNRMTAAKMQSLLNTVDSLALLRSSNPASASALYVESEQAYFYYRMNLLRQQFGWGPDLAVRVTIELLDNKLEGIVHQILSLPAIHAGRDEYPIQHGWLEVRWRDRDDGWRYAFAACATDQNPTVDTWLRLLATLPAPGGREATKYMLQVLHLWAYRVQDKKAFSWKTRCTLARLSSGKVGEKDKLLVDDWELAKQQTNAWVNARLIRAPLTQLLNSLQAAL